LVAFVVSLTIIALFAQERWWSMVALSAWVCYCTYMNGGSRRQYFWFVAGFASVIICFDAFSLLCGKVVPFNVAGCGPIRWPRTCDHF